MRKINSLLVKFILRSLVVLTFSILFVEYLTYSSMSRNIKDLTQDQQQKLVKSFADKLSQDIRTLKADTQLLSSLPSIGDFILNSEYGLEQEANTALQDSYFFIKQLYQRTPQYQRISICFSDLAMAATFADGQLIQANGSESCLGSGFAEMRILSKLDSQEPQIIASTALNQQSRHLGVIEVAYSLEGFLNFLSQQVNFESGYFSLHDDQGQLLESQQQIKLRDQEKQQAENNHSTLQYKAMIPEINWTLQSVVYADEIYFELNKSLMIVAVFVVITLILEILLLTMVTRRIVLRPLKRLLDATKSVQSGKFDTEIAVHSNDEFGDLTRSFNLMAAHLQSYILQLQKEKDLVKQNQEMLQSILDNTTSVFCIKTIDSTFKVVNNEFLRLFDKSEDEIIGKNNYQLFPPHVARQFTNNDQQVLQHAKPLKFEESATTAGGEERHYISVKFPLFNLNGDVDAICSISTDITELIDSEKKLQTANQKLNLINTIFQTSQEAMLILDSLFNIVDCNPSFESIFGYQLAEIKGQEPIMIRSGRHQLEFYRKVRSKVLESGHWHGEMWTRNQTGKIFPQLVTITAIKDFQGQITNYAALFSDISALKATEEKLHKLAHFDALTGLANRVLLKERTDELVKQSRRNKKQFAVFFLDLDNFKYINDSLGHNVGDQLIVKVARRLKRMVRETDTVARLGGDEFILLLSNIEKHDDLVNLAEKVQTGLAKPFSIEDREFYITSSIGISIFPDDAKSSSELMRNADAAMYSAKDKGKNIYQFFSADFNKKVMQRLKYETDLHYAVKNQAFVLNFQPLVNPGQDRIIKMEALVRWNNNGEVVSPVEFIPVAEETGLILPIGDWIVEESCRALKQLLDLGVADICVSINLSVIQFHDVNLAKRLAEIVDKHQVAHHQIEFEITESVLIGDYTGAQTILRQLQAQGFGLVLDDFGTGFSSLGYLKHLPFNALKLDRLFVKDILQSQTDREIVKAIITMAQALQMEVVCEGIETKEQLEQILSLGDVTIQGYFYSKPLPLPEFAEFVKAF